MVILPRFVCLVGSAGPTGLVALSGCSEAKSPGGVNCRGFRQDMPVKSDDDWMLPPQQQSFDRRPVHRQVLTLVHAQHQNNHLIN